MTDAPRDELRPNPFTPKEHGGMSLYELHRLMSDLIIKPELKEMFKRDREAIYQRYALETPELAALRDQNIYRLQKMGVNAYLLAPYAQLLGHALADFAELLRAGGLLHESTRSRSGPLHPDFNGPDRTAADPAPASD